MDVERLGLLLCRLCLTLFPCHRCTDQCCDCGLKDVEARLQCRVDRVDMFNCGVAVNYVATSIEEILLGLLRYLEALCGHISIGVDPVLKLNNALFELGRVLCVSRHPPLQQLVLRLHVLQSLHESQLLSRCISAEFRRCARCSIPYIVNSARSW